MGRRTAGLTATDAPYIDMPCQVRRRLSVLCMVMANNILSTIECPSDEFGWFHRPYMDRQGARRTPYLPIPTTSAQRSSEPSCDDVWVFLQETSSSQVAPTRWLKLGVLDQFGQYHVLSISAMSRPRGVIVVMVLPRRTCKYHGYPRT